MAIEAKRGCGFRKVGGLYLVGGQLSEPCHRLPFALTVCPCCSAGIKQTRGWTWIDAPKLLGGGCVGAGFADQCTCGEFCVVCRPSIAGRCGLLWIGGQFYGSSYEFLDEARRMGVSRRIHTIPRGFKVGETWVYLAHKDAMPEPSTLVDVLELRPEDDVKPSRAGIFAAFLPLRVEKLITQSQATPETLDDLNKRGITPVVVPDDDKDHQGSVYDKNGDDE